MEPYLVVNVGIAVLIAILVVAVLKTCFCFSALSKVGYARRVSLQNEIKRVALSEGRNSQLVAELDDSHSAYMNKLFQITKDVLSLQNIIFDK
ncbi:hypothetical protein [Hyunsoonleella rubra]|uniref:Uncharacterized protein n=1 Tax=Hyunsoonleella rubra TaxID=1737062 RepID=A0ABW5T815_9FLAO